MKNEQDVIKLTLHKTRRLKVIPWDAFTSERSIGMNCEVTVKWDD